MFVILDTNHFQELVLGTGSGRRLKQRLLRADVDAFTTVITAQEITQGWAAEINRRRAGRDQVKAYGQFLTALRALEAIVLLPFDTEAGEVFHALPAGLRRIGTMDLKIASIALSHGALLLSRNLVHFQKVPGLRVENWLDEDSKGER
jgi:tRNA(fMet)-specific endonuclease VapC